MRQEIGAEIPSAGSESFPLIALSKSIALKPPCFSRGIQRDPLFCLGPGAQEIDCLPLNKIMR